jgi:bifunctional non-homologous end joining protein LigD
MLGQCFYQKNFAAGLPPGVPTKEIRAESADRMVRYIVGGSKRTLLALVNLGSIAIHTMNCRAASVDRPDWLVFDLDPPEGGFPKAVAGALIVKQVLDEHGVRSFPKTSGGKGLHLFVPLKPGPTQEQVRGFAKSVGAEAERRRPELLTTSISKAGRSDRVFLDALRNAFGQTVVAPWSVRHRPGAPISVPLAWDEVDARLDPSAFTLRTIERRLREPDPWAGFFEARQRLDVRTR